LAVGYLLLEQQSVISRCLARSGQTARRHIDKLSKAMF
jgi:hypothetical protein